MIEAYKKAGAQVRAMTREEFDQWIELAKKTAWPEFAAKSADAKELLELLQQVK